MQKEKHWDSATFEGDMDSFPGVVFEVRGRGKWNGSSKKHLRFKTPSTLRFNPSLHIHKKNVMQKRSKKVKRDHDSVAFGNGDCELNQIITIIIGVK